MGQSFSHAQQHGRTAGHQQEHGAYVKSYVNHKGVACTFGAQFSPGYKLARASGFNFTPPATLPTSVDHRQPGSVLYPQPPIYNQGTVGSCTAQSTSALFANMLRKQTSPTTVLTDPSRYFQYYYTLSQQGDVNTDTGSTNPLAIKTMQNGVTTETLSPYDGKTFSTAPSLTAQKDSLYRSASTTSYTLTPTPTNLKASLYYGYPFVVAFQVYEGQSDFFFGKQGTDSGSIDPTTGQKSGGSSVAYVMPSDTSGNAIGGHSVLVVGYDEQFTGSGAGAGKSAPQSVFIVRNSWTDTWGDGGYFYVTEADMTTGGSFADHMIIVGANDHAPPLQAPSVTGAPAVPAIVNSPADLVQVPPATPPPAFGPPPAPVAPGPTPSPSPGPAPAPSPPSPPQPAPTPGGHVPTSSFSHSAYPQGSWQDYQSYGPGGLAPFARAIVSPVPMNPTPAPAPPPSPASPPPAPGPSPAPGSTAPTKVVTVCPAYLSAGACQ
jgi:hypothetical protein